MASIIKKDASYITLESNKKINEDISIDEIKWPFELAEWQINACKFIKNGLNLLVSAPTGSGKTVPAIYALIIYLMKGYKCVYTAPIKVLSEQKYGDLKTDFENMFTEICGREIRIGMMTGDTQINRDADVIVGTPEIIRNSLYNFKNNKIKKSEKELKDNFLDKLGCVIFDEVHYFNDKERGGVYEEIITLSSILFINPIALIMLSATIENPQRFCNWITETSKKNTKLIKITKRNIPLVHYFLDISDGKDGKDLIFNTFYENGKFNEESLNIISKISKNKKYISQHTYINYAVEYFRKNDMLQTLVFCFSIKKCETFSNYVLNSLLTNEEELEVIREFNRLIRPHKKEFEESYYMPTIEKLIRKGICFHHSGVPPKLKKIIQFLYEKQLLKLLFVTETFAVGVNGSSNTVAFINLIKPDGDKMRILKSSEYLQMAGRAGRRVGEKDEKKKNVGHVVILNIYNDLPPKENIKLMVSGKVDSFKSQLNITDYNFILKMILMDSINTRDFFEKTFFIKDLNDQFESEIFYINISKGKINKYKKIYNKTEEELLIKYKNLDPNYDLNYINYGIKKKESQNQKKKREKKMNKIIVQINNFENKYKDFINYQELIEEYKLKENNLNEKKKSNDKHNINNSCDKYLHLLKKKNYIKNNNKKLFELSSDDVLEKGIIASQIHECNSLLLTEMLYRNVFDNLDEKEIVAILSIFIGKNSKDEIVNNKISLPVSNSLSIIKEIINEFQETEREVGYDVYNVNFWEINQDYIEIAYKWVSNYNYKLLRQEYSLIEGKFIKNIIKLYNIVKNLIYLTEISGKMESKPKLEKIEELIIRKFVNTNSLFI